jgi:hypothetical protein
MHRAAELADFQAPSTPARSLPSRVPEPRTPVNRAPRPTTSAAASCGPVHRRSHVLRPVPRPRSTSNRSSPTQPGSSPLVPFSPPSSPAHPLLLLSDSDSEDETGYRDTYFRAHSRRRRVRHDVDADDDFFTSSNSSPERAGAGAGKASGRYADYGPLAILLGQTKRLSLRDVPFPSPASGSTSRHSLSSLTRGFDRCRMSTLVTQQSSPSERVKRRKATPTAPRAMLAASKFASTPSGTVAGTGSGEGNGSGTKLLFAQRKGIKLDGGGLASHQAQALQPLEGPKRKLAEADAEADADDGVSSRTPSARAMKRVR